MATLPERWKKKAILIMIDHQWSIADRGLNIMITQVPYILEFADFQQFCDEEGEKLYKSNGICRDCINKELCNNDNRRNQIDALLKMNNQESRFPKLLSFIKQHRELLQLTPSVLYDRLYGKYHTAFPCPFNSSKILQNLNKIEDTYRMLSDTYSKYVYLNTLMYRLTFNYEYVMRAYSAEPQYFIKPFRNLSSKEVFVDCGAYIGDTFEQYCYYNEVPGFAYLCEPDPLNIEKIYSTLQRMGIQNQIEVIDKAIYNYTGTMYFNQTKHGENGNLQDVSEIDSVPVEVTSIDDCIDRDVSFIKMDIEGSEMRAIEGARKHIKNSYPKLAKSVYHKLSDLWEIPLAINEMFPN